MMKAITAADIELLGRILRNERPLPSNHVVRLELLGLVRDAPGGPHITQEGERLMATQDVVFVPAERIENGDRDHDVLGRRKRRGAPPRKRSEAP